MGHTFEFYVIVRQMPCVGANGKGDSVCIYERLPQSTDDGKFGIARIQLLRRWRAQ